MILRLSRAKLKYFKALEDKNTRVREGLFLAEGRKLVAEGLKEGWICRSLIGNEEETQSLANEFGIANADHYAASPSEIAQISTLKNPEPLLAAFEIREDSFNFEASQGLILDGISDPGNLGTLIRTADWFGISQILAGPGTADRFNAKVLRSSMGSVFRVNFASSANLLADLSQHGAKIWAANMEGYSPEIMKTEKRPFLLLGNESNGISQSLMQLPGIQRISIPSNGSAESLNLAVAGGILMYLKT